MQLSIIISGNLTGFSRFYASPNANDVYNEAKFDFDYRNFVTFLNNGEKAYAISFSPRIIAVSLITRILDSFRRPGILVVTALVPRNQLVRGQLNPNDKTAIFKLLNEVNDKFYERNFINGMVNQNPAVLMQDYYSDILSRYTFVNDRMQKPVNSTIDIASPNKRIGYVAAADASMPQYLSSIMRKSYEGYHHVFLSPHAPQNIDEPAEEILTYRVRMENGKRVVPGEVRLSDRIPNVTPEQGYKDIPNKNFTYGQVLSGEAGMDIVASIENGDTILLTYRFPEEEKTVYFKFYDGANEVPIPLIRPILVESNGTRINIPSECMTFRGAEIYGRKTIKSGNSEYTIENGSKNVDLQRIHDGGTFNVFVQKGWKWTFAQRDSYQRPVSIKPVNITLVNRFNGERKSFANVTGDISEQLSGTPSEWEMIIQSDYYKDVHVLCTSRYRLDPKPVQQREAGVTTVNEIQGRRTDSRNVSTINGQKSQGLNISKGDSTSARDTNEIKRDQNKKYLTYGLSAVVACLLIVCGVWGYKALFGNAKKETAKGEDPELVDEQNLTESKTVAFTFFDSDGDELSSDTKGVLEISFDPEQIISVSEDGSAYVVKYNPNEAEPQKFKINVSFKNINMLAKDYQPIFVIKEMNDVENIRLSVKGSEIKLYEKVSKPIAAKDFEDVSNEIQAVFTRNEPYGVLLAQELAKSKPAEPLTKQDALGKKDKSAPKESTKDNTIRDGFNALSLLLGPDKESLMSNKQKLKPQNKFEEERNDALISVLKQLNRGEVPCSTPQALSSKQQKIINDLRHYKQSLDNSGKAKLRSDLKKWKSLSQIQDNILPKKDNH